MYLSPASIPVTASSIKFNFHPTIHPNDAVELRNKDDEISGVLSSCINNFPGKCPASCHCFGNVTELLKSLIVTDLGLRGLLVLAISIKCCESQLLRSKFFRFFLHLLRNILSHQTKRETNLSKKVCCWLKRMARWWHLEGQLAIFFQSLGVDWKSILRFSTPLRQ